MAIRKPIVEYQVILAMFDDAIDHQQSNLTAYADDLDESHLVFVDGKTPTRFGLKPLSVREITKIRQQHPIKADDMSAMDMSTASALKALLWMDDGDEKVTDPESIADIIGPDLTLAIGAVVMSMSRMDSAQMGNLLSPLCGRRTGQDLNTSDSTLIPPSSETPELKNEPEKSVG